MNSHLWCELGAISILLAIGLIIGAYHLGRWREQLSLLEMYKPEH